MTINEQVAKKYQMKNQALRNQLEARLSEEFKNQPKNLRYTLPAAAVTADPEILEEDQIHAESSGNEMEDGEIVPSPSATAKNEILEEGELPPNMTDSSMEDGEIISSEQ